MDIDEQANSPDNPTIKQDMKQLASEMRDFAQAEIAYYQARFAYSKAVAKRSAVYFSISIIAFFGAAIAFILGLLLILAHYFGPVFATLIVTGASISIALISAFLGRNNARNFKFPEIEDEDNG
ncbi:MAG: phage holin family protein [Sphingomonadales bacterium]|nr:phage holin family protein [Sphingomonadales bacterium]